MKRLLLASILFLTSFLSLTARETLLISDHSDDYLVSNETIVFYKDPTGRLAPKDILSRSFSSLPLHLEAPDAKTANFWLRFKISNTSSRPKWLLEILDFGIQQVAFYDIHRDSLIETGYAVPFFQRVYAHKNFVFDLSIPPGETREYLVKVASSSSFGPVMKIRTSELFISYANKEYLLLGFYYGLLILIASYNLFLFISIRDNTHLYYIFYVVSIGLRSLQGDGLGFQYLWPSFPVLNEWLGIAPPLLLLSFSAYAISFLELRKHYPTYYKIILTLTGLYFLLFLADIFYDVPYLQLIYLIPFLVIYSIAIIIYRKGYKPARFFIVGYSLLILSQIVYFAITRGLQLENEIIILLFVYSLNIGFVTEVFIFSIALADKVRLFKKEKETALQSMIDQLKINEELKDKINRELELKVSERTRELEEAKIKLQEQADQINTMNRFLDLENHKLKNDVKEINRERGLLKALSFEEFTQTFPDESTCYRFIEELKWGDHFSCHKCGHPKFLKGKDLFARKCTKCNYIETIKANTIFHNLKFPIEKAFQLIYLTLLTEEEISTYELARLLELQQKTCWSFRQKIMDKIRKERISKKDLIEKGWSILIRE